MYRPAMGRSGNPNHTFLRITPDNQAGWRNHPAFIQGSDGKVFATIGAGPAGFPPRLEAALNRPEDVSFPAQGSVLDLGGANEDQVIAKLFAAVATYQDDLFYETFPSNRFWGGLGEHNSNSLSAGLLNFVGLDVPAVPNAPGLENPVPARHFR